MADNLGRMSLLERLRLGVSQLSVREWLIFAAVGLALIGYGVFTAKRGGACYGEQLQVQRGLDQSERDIRALSQADLAGRCSAYRHRRELLAKSSDLMNRCGIGRSEVHAGRAGELRFYTALVERQCREDTPK